MVRLLGILIGASIATAILIIVVGIPEIPEQADETDRPAAADRSVQLPPAAPPRRDAEPEAEAAALPAPASAEPFAEAPRAEVPSAAAPIAEAALATPPVTEIPDQQAATQARTAPDAATDNWYAFWSPFRSEFAARGFVSQLQKTTGLDYRVIKQDTGVYEVAFAYSDDADVMQKLELIQSATGLELPGS